MYTPWRRFWLSLKLLKQKGVLHRKLHQMTCCCVPRHHPEGKFCTQRIWAFPRYYVDLRTRGNTQLWIHLTLFNCPKMPLSSLQYASRGSQTFAHSEHLVLPERALGRALTSSLAFFTFNFTTFSGLLSPNPLLIHFLMKTSPCFLNQIVPARNCPLLA